MTDRSAEDFAVESYIACEHETGVDFSGDGRAEIDRDQRYLERYGNGHVAD